MKLEVGKYYRTASGEKVQIEKSYANYCVASDGWHYKYDGECTYLGRTDPDWDRSHLHIVEEWVENNYSDGKWHGWNGGSKCPVDSETEMEVVCLDETSESRPLDWLGSTSIIKAKYISEGCWLHRNGFRKVISFRVVETKPKEIWVNEYPNSTYGVHGTEEEARKMLEGVTPGPWMASSSVLTNDGNRAVTADDTGIAWVHSQTPYSRGDGRRHECEEREANARFIAWCREGVPALLARLEAAEAEVEKLRGALDDLLDAITATDRHGDRTLTITGPIANLKCLLEAEEEARAALITENPHDRA